MELDLIDGKILSLLKQNSRMHNVEIANRIGLTEGAVRSRIVSLVLRKVIGKFTIEASGDASMFGIVMLKAKGETKKMMREVTALSLHVSAFEISGEFDGCAVLEADSITSLDEKIDALRKCSHVADTRTFIAVKKW
ncbi:MAG: Lrp/AsnC family transcriptional regulator [Candidatus Micrarchaeota archaeon]